MFSKKDKYDLVIVGAGLAGLSAAVSAKQQHIDTLVVEKGRTIGGDGNYVEGAMGVDSFLQKQNGISIDKTELLADELRFSHYEASAPHLKKFIDNSGDTIDWLHSLDVEFLKVGPQGDSWPTIHTFKGGGKAAVTKLYEQAINLGAEFIKSVSAFQVIQKDGKVSGLLVRNEVTGQFKTIFCSNIILATGGYVDNPNMIKMRTCYSDRLMPVSDGKSTGDGIRIAWDAGAKKYSMGAIQYGGGAIFDKILPPYMHMASQLAAAATQEAVLWVNERGDRFVNEDVNDNMCHAGGAILNQTKVFSILDQNAVDYLTNVGLYKEVGNSPISPTKFDSLQNEINTDLSKHSRYLTSAMTIEDLGEKLKLSNLGTTIRHYNNIVESGMDSDFGKNNHYLNGITKGPFFAIELGVGMACAIGGLRVDTDNKILNDYGYPVPGLYAVGNDAAGVLVGDTYDVTVPGSTAGYAVYSSRNAIADIYKGLSVVV